MTHIGQLLLTGRIKSVFQFQKVITEMGFLRFVLFSIMCICMGLCLSMCACGCRCPQSPEEGVDPHKTGVIGSHVS